MKIFAAFLLTAVPALAAPITGTIGFTYTYSVAIDYTLSLIPGLDAPTGSYTFDPGTGLFSNLTVLWGEATFDLTSSANSPSMNTGCSSDPSSQAYGYSLITQSVTGCPPSGATGFLWTGTYYGDSGYATFEFLLANGATNDVIGVFSDPFGSDQSVGYEYAQGVWNPEPGTISMLLLGAAALAGVMKARSPRR